MTKFKVGDLVLLKSGGPIMTVDFVENSLIRTIWFVNDNAIREGFEPSELILVQS